VKWLDDVQSQFAGRSCLSERELMAELDLRRRCMQRISVKRYASFPKNTAFRLAHSGVMTHSSGSPRRQPHAILSPDS